MAKEKAYIFSLNGGELSPLAQGRVDLARSKIAAEVMRNMIPRVIGPASARPGTQYIGTIDSGNVKTRILPFVFSATDTALVELGWDSLRVWVDGALVSRPSVSTQITSDTFSSSSGWTLATTGTGVATVTSGNLKLQTPGRGDTVRAYQAVSVAVADRSVEHAIEIDVVRGPVKFRVGSGNGGDQYLREVELATGFHSLSVTPTSGNMYVQFSAESESERLVNSCKIASSGTMEIETPWSYDDLADLRFDQSGDVIYITSAARTFQPKRIIRYGTNSWSLVDYDFTDGPFRGKTADVTLTPSARTGNGTLTASGQFFDDNHVGCVFRITHSSTSVSSVLTGEDRYTESVRVSGNTFYDIDSDGSNENTDERDVTLNITGTWSGTLSMEVSYDEEGEWKRLVDYSSSPVTTTLTPGYANSVAYCRLGFQAGDYTSGAATCSLSYDGGGGDGYVLITSVESQYVAHYEVVRRLHDTKATNEWSEGQFSTLRGWPAAVGLFEGRLWWGSQDKIFGSVSDLFTSFDLDEEGDSGPIIRSIATGAVNSVQWILGLSRLCVGTSGAEPVGRSSSFDEPVTPTNFSLKDVSTQGSASVQAVKVDKSAIFVQRSGKRAYELSYMAEQQDYGATEISRYHPTILDAGVKIMAVQRQPDTRVWFVLDDGTCAILTYERSEDVISWYRFDIDNATVEDIAVLPNVDDDDVYLLVKRGGTYTLERLSYDHQAQGGQDNYMADCWVSSTLTDSDTVSGLPTVFAGKDLVVWAAGEAIMDGDEPKTFRASYSGGQYRITLPSAVTGKVVVGFPYTWQWKSAKLAYGVADGAPISRRKMLRDVAPVLYKTHIRGIKAGQDFSSMDYLPLSYKGETKTGNEVYETYDVQSQCIPGGWDTDARLCFQGQSPLPCTILAVTITMEGH